MFFLRDYCLHEKVDLLICMVRDLAKKENRLMDDVQLLQDAFDKHEAEVQAAVAEIIKLVGERGDAALRAKVEEIAGKLDSSTGELKDAITTAEPPAPAPEPTPEPTV